MMTLSSKKHYVNINENNVLFQLFSLCLTVILPFKNENKMIVSCSNGSFYCVFS